MTKYVFFSTQFKTFVDSFGGWGEGGCLNPSLTFPIYLYENSASLDIWDRNNVTIHPLAPEHSNFNKKVTRNGNLRCFVAKSVVTNIRYARFFVFFGTPQVGPFVKFECIFYALVRTNLQRWTGFEVLLIFGVKF